MIETELKFEIKNKSEILEKLGHKVVQHEISIMYDNAAGLMQATNGRIRVRNNEILTYKKPIASQDGAKREIEYEVRIDGNIEPILKEMGFEPTTGYERYRTEWLVDEVKITLDEYAFADFIELEGELEKIKLKAQELGLSNPTDKAIDTIYTERFGKTKFF